MRVKKSYVFAVDFEQEEDGRWSVDIPAVPVCAAWGFTREEALENLQDLTQGYLKCSSNMVILCRKVLIPVKLSLEETWSQSRKLSPSTYEKYRQAGSPPSQCSHP